LAADANAALLGLDVFIAESLKRLHARLPGDPAVSAMLRAAAALRDESYVAFAATFGEPRYTELLLRSSWRSWTGAGAP